MALRNLKANFDAINQAEDKENRDNYYNLSEIGKMHRRPNSQLVSDGCGSQERQLGARKLSDDD